MLVQISFVSGSVAVFELSVIKSDMRLNTVFYTPPKAYCCRSFVPLCGLFVYSRPLFLLCGTCMIGRLSRRMVTLSSSYPPDFVWPLGRRLPGLRELSPGCIGRYPPPGWFALNVNSASIYAISSLASLFGLHCAKNVICDCVSYILRTVVGRVSVYFCSTCLRIYGT